MKNKTDLMLEVFANYNTTFEIIEAIETPTIKKIETEK